MAQHFIMFITQSIVRAPDFWGTALQMIMITDSVSPMESVFTDYLEVDIIQVRAWRFADVAACGAVSSLVWCRTFREI